MAAVGETGADWGAVRPCLRGAQPRVRRRPYKAPGWSAPGWLSAGFRAGRAGLRRQHGGEPAGRVLEFCRSVGDDREAVGRAGGRAVQPAVSHGDGGRARRLIHPTIPRPHDPTAISSVDAGAVVAPVCYVKTTPAVYVLCNPARSRLPQPQPGPHCVAFAAVR